MSEPPRPNSANPAQPDHVPAPAGLGPAPDAEAFAADTGGDSPYRSLWLPLVVVPALIVIAMVLVFALFGAIAGTEATPAENLERMLGGGVNERRQAMMNLVGQALRSWEARAEGREPEWDIDQGFRPELASAWERCPEEDVEQRYVLAMLLTRLGDPDGMEHLLSILALPPERDPEGEVRFHAIYEVALSARERGGEAVDRAVRAILPFLESPDPGLALVAVGALQVLPGPATVEALEGMLGMPRLDLRGQAAISLSHLGEPSGAPVLRELLLLEPYRSENAADPHRWARAEDVSRSRRRALEGLLRLGLPEDEARIRSIASGPEPDIELSAAALEALETWGRPRAEGR